MPLQNIYRELSADQKVHLFDAAANPAFKNLLNKALQEVNDNLTDIGYDGTNPHRLAEKYSALQKERRFILDLQETLQNCVTEFTEKLNQEQ